MNDGRLPAHVEVSALIRQVQAQGGTAAVLGRGDRDAGSILVLLAERGVPNGQLERRLTPAGEYRWSYLVLNTEQKQMINQIAASRRAVDPDLWIIELDVSQAERFAAQLTDEG